MRRTDGRETDGMMVRFRMMSCASLGLKRAMSVVSGESFKSEGRSGRFGEGSKRSPSVPRRLSPKTGTKKGGWNDGGQVEVRVDSNFA